MKYTIKHNIPGRIRFQNTLKYLTQKQADAAEVYFLNEHDIIRCRVNSRLGTITLEYSCDFDEIISIIRKFHPDEDTGIVPFDSTRKINEEFRERLTNRILGRIIMKTVVPAPIRTAVTTVLSFRFFLKTLAELKEKKIKMNAVNTASILASYATADYESAGDSVFLASMGDMMEGYIEKKKIESLSEMMKLNIDYVNLLSDGAEIMTPADEIRESDVLIVREGNLIPFDGIVLKGNGSLIQTSMTGNMVPVPKTSGDQVYAGTTLNEGELVIKVSQVDQTSMYDKILSMVENSENLKPEYEMNAIKKMDSLSPYLLLSGGVTFLLTGSLGKASAFWKMNMTNGLKMVFPLSVIGAKDVAAKEKMIVKGGKFMEKMARANAIVLDKTGTLTKAEPVLTHIHSFGDYYEDELLMLGACMEEHFPHTMAKAIIKAAEKRGMEHAEMHTEIEHILAHGVKTTIGGKTAVLGSYHFVFDDEKCVMPEGALEVIEGSLDRQLFLAMDHKLEGIFCIEDTLKEDAVGLIEELKKQGFEKIVLLTGDSLKSTQSMAKTLGITEYKAQVLPEEKAEYIRNLQKEGYTVAMVGDGLNDSLALSVADVGIAISEGAKLTRSIADVIVDDCNIMAISELRTISKKMLQDLKREFYGVSAVGAGVIAWNLMTTP